MNEKTQRIFAYDRALGSPCVAGIDEAGRGPLAGPVVAACVILPLDTPIDGIFDSKQVSEKKRESLYEEIVRRAAAYGVGIVNNEQIDRINILAATKQAMTEAFAAMGKVPERLLVDAVTGLNLPCPTHAIVHGDATSYHIAAASILAKVTRDRIMRAYDAQYPAYGFAQNKGYGTSAHIKALCRVGKCALHRNTFIGHFAVAETAATSEGDDE